MTKEGGLGVGQGGRKFVQGPSRRVFSSSSSSEVGIMHPHSGSSLPT